MSYARFGSPMQEFETPEEHARYREERRKQIDALDDPFGWGDKVDPKFKGSDVYVLLNVGGFLECCGCIIDKSEFLQESKFHTTDEMIKHLEKHRELGHNVPDSCFRRLEAEKEENDKWMKDFDPSKI